MSATPAPGGKRGRGQATKFNPEQLRPLVDAGTNDSQIARFLGIDRKSLFNWKRTHPEFFANRAVLPVPGRRRRVFRVEHVGQAQRFYESGLTTLDVAKILCVHRSTLDRWRHQYPEFGQAVQTGRAAASQLRTKDVAPRRRGAPIPRTGDRP